VNKWDTMVPLPTGRMGDYIRATFPSLSHVPIAFITAKSGRNVQQVLNLAQTLHKQAIARVSTGDLNRVVRQALEANPPPMRQNRRAKVYYATQVATNPPTIVLFTNGPELFDNTYQRYLLKTFRDQLPFAEVAIKLHLRAKRREDESDGEEPVQPLRRKPGAGRGRSSEKQPPSELWRD
jgi:GTP-binding protein